LETALESRFNPLLILGRSGSLGLGSFVNKFNADAELLDDLNDHWTAKSHKVSYETSFDVSYADTLVASRRKNATGSSNKCSALQRRRVFVYHF